MRSAVLAGLLVLTGCDASSGGDVSAKDSASDHAVMPSPPADQFEPGPVATTTIEFEKLPVSPPDFQFRAVGTEPFWSARLSGRKLVYSTPEEIKGKAIDVLWASFDEHGVQQWRGKLNDKDLVLKIKLEKCSDGMSDKVFDYVAELRIGDDLRKGCAERE